MDKKQERHHLAVHKWCLFIYALVIRMSFLYEEQPHSGPSCLIFDDSGASADAEKVSVGFFVFVAWELYGFLVTGDVLDQPEYSVADLSQANHSLEKFYLALELAME